MTVAGTEWRTAELKRLERAKARLETMLGRSTNKASAEALRVGIEHIEARASDIRGRASED